MKKALAVLILGLMALAGPVLASTIVLVNESALARDTSFSVDQQALGADVTAAQATYSSAAPDAVAFSDGQVASGVVTVASLGGLIPAYMHVTITVAATSTLSGMLISVPGVVLKARYDWAIGATTAQTAANIAAAITAKMPGIVASSVGSVVYATATSIGYDGTITVSPTSSGLVLGTRYAGSSNATLAINNISLTANHDWSPGASVSEAATSIAAAINAHSILKLLVSATANSPSPGQVTVVSRRAGYGSNYSMASSAPSALTLSGPAMTGGADSAYSLGGLIFSIPAHGLSTGLAVLYTQAAGKPIGGLTDKATYYVAAVTADHISLATSKANAINSVFVTFTSSSTPAVGGSDAYSLAPLAISGTPSFKWQVSSNGSSWSDVAADSVTMTSYSLATKTWNFGVIGFRYLRLAVVGPTTGGIYLSVQATAQAAFGAAYVNKVGDTMSGPLTNPVGFVGPLTGGVTGDVIGDVTGAASENVLKAGTDEIVANYTDDIGAADGTAFYSFVSTMASALPSGAEVSNLLGRIRWYKGDNSNAVLNGLEGVCSSTVGDESITCRGASLRTYTSPGASLRSSFGADVSARSSYAGGTENVAEPGTAFVGARVWMAPYFTDGTLANINNFHGLWIYNEAAAKAVTNGVKIGSAGGGFTHDINLPSGDTIDNTTAGVITVSGALELKAKTLAELLADTPAKAGLSWYCSDCTVDGVVVSTAATPGGVANYANRAQVIQ